MVLLLVGKCLHCVLKASSPLASAQNRKQVPQKSQVSEKGGTCFRGLLSPANHLFNSLPSSKTPSCVRDGDGQEGPTVF